LQCRLSDTVNVKNHVIGSKDGIDWIFRADHMTLAITIVERQYWKDSLI